MGESGREKSASRASATGKGPEMERVRVCTQNP